MMVLAAATAFALPIAADASHHKTAPEMTSTAAMPTCAAGDPVVWINTKSNVYHAQGDRYFGKTKNGKYACTSAAVAAGAKAAGHGAAMHGHAMASAMPEATPAMTSGKHHHHRHHGDASPVPSPGM